jgi:hypothetical protein
MHTLKLKINDRVYDRLIALLSKFEKGDVEIVSETSEFANNKAYLSQELNEILTEKTSFLTLEETEQRFETVINKVVV